ncbi:arsinothricin resistance N-acetyltransferase ArsN1 family B [Nostoc sp. MS1]|uniref:arsinothricin resistance N-acetyltransferase ArsN1 family B n=1 Tax=Nostoc sp. MS1 TaxID=2764711 RepID=UPI001CC7C563|nr:arsinothricin resistance N-acetyltransferase ArsN1 family B [Nostoc sp. MS1]BCL39058.1 N-acetyltransferase [Nostoc sp. MS1]
MNVQYTKVAIRLAQEDDALSMLAIYAPIVRETPISFEIEPPTEAEFKQRMHNYQKQMPWLVCEIDGELVGYAYATPYRTRAAYQWSVESSVYVSAKHRQIGVATALYTSLFQLLKLQGFYNVFAAITIPNPSSIAAHESMGFSPVGVFKQVGYKLGTWHDIGWWQLSLQEKPDLIEPPQSFVEVQKYPMWNVAIASGLSLVRV